MSAALDLTRWRAVMLVLELPSGGDYAVEHDRDDGYLALYRAMPRDPWVVLADGFETAVQAAAWCEADFAERMLGGVL